MIKFFFKRSTFQYKYIWGLSTKAFSSKNKSNDDDITAQLKSMGVQDENELNKMLENQQIDKNLDKLISEKIDQGKSDQQIINEFLGSVGGGVGGSSSRRGIPKQIKTKEKLTEKEIKNNEFNKFMDTDSKEINRFSMLYNNKDNIIAEFDPNASFKLKSKNLNKLKTEIAEQDSESSKNYTLKERGVSKKLLDKIPFSEKVRKDLEKPEKLKKQIDEVKDENTPHLSEGRINMKKFKDAYKSEDDEDKESLKNFDQKKDFKTLVEEDLNSEFKQLKEKVDKDEEKRKIAKMTNKPVYDVNGKDQDQKLRRTAILLGKLWQLTPAQKKHWYRRLKREEKEVAKKMIKLKEREEKRRLKKLSKKWKMENDDIIDINYLEDKSQTNEEVKIPGYCQNFKEYSFFEDDMEFMRHYKRTCKNVENAIEEIINGHKQSFEMSIRHNQPIQISKVTMNKAMTVIHVWWDLPLVDFGEKDKEEKLDISELRNKVELRLNQSIPFIRSKLTKKIGLKYAPEIRFYKDSKNEDVIDYREGILNLIEPENSNSVFKDIYNEKLNSKNPLSLEQKEKLNNEYEKELKNILDSAETPEMRKELEEMNSIMKDKNMLNLTNEFMKGLEFIDKDGETKNKIMGDLKKYAENKKELENMQGTKKKIVGRNPLEMNMFTPQDKVGQRMIKERNKFLSSIGLSINDFKGEKKNKLKELNLNKEVLNYALNYEYEVPTKAVEERNKGIKQGFKDLANLSNAERNSEKIMNKVTKEGNTKIKAKNERQHHKKKRQKSEEFWENLEQYYDK